MCDRSRHGCSSASCQGATAVNALSLPRWVVPSLAGDERSRRSRPASRSASPSPEPLPIAADPIWRSASTHGSEEFHQPAQGRSSVAVERGHAITMDSIRRHRVAAGARDGLSGRVRVHTGRMRAIEGRHGARPQGTCVAATTTRSASEAVGERVRAQRSDLLAQYARCFLIALAASAAFRLCVARMDTHRYTSRSGSSAMTCSGGSPSPASLLDRRLPAGQTKWCRWIAPGGPRRRRVAPGRCRRMRWRRGESWSSAVGAVT